MYNHGIKQNDYSTNGGTSSNQNLPSKNRSNTQSTHGAVIKDNQGNNNEPTNGYQQGGRNTKAHHGKTHNRYNTGKQTIHG